MSLADANAKVSAQLGAEMAAGNVSRTDISGTIPGWHPEWGPVWKYDIKPYVPPEKTEPPATEPPATPAPDTGTAPTPAPDTGTAPTPAPTAAPAPTGGTGGAAPVDTSNMTAGEQAMESGSIDPSQGISLPTYVNASDIIASEPGQFGGGSSTTINAGDVIASEPGQFGGGPPSGDVWGTDLNQIGATDPVGAIFNPGTGGDPTGYVMGPYDLPAATASAEPSVPISGPGSAIDAINQAAGIDPNTGMQWQVPSATSNFAPEAGAATQSPIPATPNFNETFEQFTPEVFPGVSAATGGEQPPAYDTGLITRMGESAEGGGPSTTDQVQSISGNNPFAPTGISVDPNATGGSFAPQPQQPSTSFATVDPNATGGSFAPPSGGGLNVPPPDAAAPSVNPFTSGAPPVPNIFSPFTGVETNPNAGMAPGMGGFNNPPIGSPATGPTQGAPSSGYVGPPLSGLTPNMGQVGPALGPFNDPNAAYPGSGQLYPPASTPMDPWFQPGDQQGFPTSQGDVNTSTGESAGASGVPFLNPPAPATGPTGQTGETSADDLARAAEAARNAGTGEPSPTTDTTVQKLMDDARKALEQQQNKPPPPPPKAAPAPKPAPAPITRPPPAPRAAPSGLGSNTRNFSAGSNLPYRKVYIPYVPTTRSPSEFGGESVVTRLP